MFDAVGVFEGRGLVLIGGNEGFWIHTPMSTRGRPVAEAWPDPCWTAVQRAMTAVYDTGRPAVVILPRGRLVITRLDESGRRYVVTGFVPSHVGRPSDLPARALRPLLELVRIA